VADAGVTAKNLAVGARCSFVRAGAGAVLTQQVTDMRLGPRGLDLLSEGKTANEVIEALVTGNETVGWRQLAAVDRNGGTVFNSGDSVPTMREGHQDDGCVATGNGIRNPDVPKAMIESYERYPDARLAERLLCGLEPGLAAGGQFGQITAGALLVVDTHVFPIVDLRVDYGPLVLAKLRFLWEAFEPKIDYFIELAINPDTPTNPYYVG
jgi:uncharacterized Ntn-hydrolase superfamily protein